jgi:hypothetical protein
VNLQVSDLIELVKPSWPQRRNEDDKAYADAVKARDCLAEAAGLRICHEPAFNKVKDILTALMGCKGEG